jgi:hypothetical protein
MRKWEFCRCWPYGEGSVTFETINGEEELTDETGKFVRYTSIEEAGLDGWELIQYVPATEDENVLYLFKREIIPISGCITNEDIEKNISSDIPNFFDGEEKPVEVDYSDLTQGIDVIFDKNAINQKIINMLSGNISGSYYKDRPTIAQVLALSELRLLSFRNFGPTMFLKLKEALKAKGYASYCTPEHWINS